MERRDVPWLRRSFRGAKWRWYSYCRYRDYHDVDNIYNWFDALNFWFEAIVSDSFHFNSYTDNPQDNEDHTYTIRASNDFLSY